MRLFLSFCVLSIGVAIFSCSSNAPEFTFSDRMGAMAGDAGCIAVTGLTVADIKAAGHEEQPWCRYLNDGSTVPVKVYELPEVKAPHGAACYLWADLDDGLQLYCCEGVPDNCIVYDVSIDAGGDAADGDGAQTADSSTMP